MLKHALISIALTPFCAMALDVTTTAGHLEDAIGTNLDATQLVVTGSIDVRDFKFMSDKMTALTSLDLSKASIESYSSPHAVMGDQFSFNASQLPTMAFFGSKLNTVVLPSSLNAIGESAFAGCKQLTSVSIPTTVTTVGDYAFYDCDGITSVAIPAAVTTIGKGAFAQCDGLQKVETNGGVRTIGAEAFNGCHALTQFNFPSTLLEIGDKAFYGTSVASADMSACPSLYKIGAWAFASNQALTSIKWPASVTEIGEGALAFNSQLTKVELPTSMDAVPDYLFACSPKVQPHQIPAAVLTIGKYAFAQWNATVNFTFPDQVEFIDDYAFEGWTSVKTFYATHNYAPQLGEDVFAGIDKSTVDLYVQNEEMILVFSQAEQWCEFNIKAVPDIVTDVTSPDENILAAFRGTELHVKASCEVAEAALYDPSGAMLAKVTPRSQMFSINTEAFASHAYILVIKDNDGNGKVLKIARR